MYAFEGDYGAEDDASAREALDVLQNSKFDAELRGRAATALGPGLELGSMVMDWDDPDELEDQYFSHALYEQVAEALEAAYRDEKNPQLVRRHALESAVRDPRPWQREAVENAWQADDPEWRQSALFAMAWIAGYDDHIAAALDDPDPRIHNQAIASAGLAGLTELEPKLRAIALDEDQERYTRMNAIEALVGAGSADIRDVLYGLTDHPDPEIADAAQWAVDEIDAVLFDDDIDDEP